MTQQPSLGAEISRNALCPCGSGEKYKRCCGASGGAVKAAVAAPGQQMFARGVQLLRAGRAQEAQGVLVAAVEAGAKQFEAFHALGTALLQNGRFAEASSILTHAVSLRPDSAAGFWDLGAAFDHQNMHADAIVAYLQAVTLAPKLFEVQLRLAQLFAMYSRNEEASSCFDRAADAKPKSIEARLYRSDAALLRGDALGAEKWVRQAVALEPRNAMAQGGLGGVLYSQGRFFEAAAHFEAALKLHPRSGKCWHGLAACRKYAAVDLPILERMEAVLKSRDLPQGDRIGINFAMGKILEDCGEYSRAMAQFDVANELRGRVLHFDRAELAAKVDRAIAIYSPEFFERFAADAVQDETPVFVVGVIRSGTTLVEQILSSHPMIAAGGELTFWGPGEILSEAGDGNLEAGRGAESVSDYLALLKKIGGGAARVTDKLPANLFRIGAFHALMPRAKIIHCRRNPLDTCLSIYTTLFATQISFAARKDDLVFYYQQYARMMAHWRTVLPAEVFVEVEYEKMVADREAETRRLISFVGVEWDENCLRPEANGRAIGTASAWQARQPVYGTSVARWRRFEGWAGEMGSLM